MKRSKTCAVAVAEHQLGAVPEGVVVVGAVVDGDRERGALAVDRAAVEDVGEEVPGHPGVLVRLVDRRVAGGRVVGVAGPGAGQLLGAAARRRRPGCRPVSGASGGVLRGRRRAARAQPLVDGQGVAAVGEQAALACGLGDPPQQVGRDEAAAVRAASSRSDVGREGGARHVPTVTPGADSRCGRRPPAAALAGVRRRRQAPGDRPAVVRADDRTADVLDLGRLAGEVCHTTTGCVSGRSPVRHGRTIVEAGRSSRLFARRRCPREEGRYSGSMQAEDELPPLRTRWVRSAPNAILPCPGLEMS